MKTFIFIYLYQSKCLYRIKGRNIRLDYASGGGAGGRDGSERRRCHSGALVVTPPHLLPPPPLTPRLTWLTLTKLSHNSQAQTHANKCINRTNKCIHSFPFTPTQTQTPLLRLHFITLITIDLQSQILNHNQDLISSRNQADHRIIRQRQQEQLEE